MPRLYNNGKLDIDVFLMRKQQEKELINPKPKAKQIKKNNALVDFSQIDYVPTKQQVAEALQKSKIKLFDPAKWYRQHHKELMKKRYVGFNQVLTQSEIVHITLNQLFKPIEEEVEEIDNSMEYMVQKAVDKLFSKKQVKEAFLQIKYIIADRVVKKKLTRREQQLLDHGMELVGRDYERKDFKEERVTEIAFTKLHDREDKEKKKKADFIINKDNVRSVVNRVKFEFKKSGVTAYSIGYRLVWTLKEDTRMTEKEIYNLKAFSANSDRKFKEKIEVETSTNKLCIYESYLYRIDKTNLKYIHEKKKKEKEKEISSMLKEEGEEIELAIKNGDMIRGLELLTSKYENKIILVFDNCEYSFIIDNGNHRKIKTNEIMKGTKIILYDNVKHVAPAIFDIDKHGFISKTQLKKKLYKLRPFRIYEQKEIKNILGFDIETFLDENHHCKVFNICVYGVLHGKQKRKSFYGIDADKEFVEWIHKISSKVGYGKSRPKHKVDPIYFYGFNNSRFDNLLIYSQLYDKNPGTKYMFSNNSIKHIKYENIRIFDISLFYSVGTLRETCQAFRLEEEKGVYPYGFANKHTLDYVGEVPGPEYWNTGDYEDYEGGEIFNMKEYTIKYCMLDSKLVYELAKLHLNMCNGTIKGKKYSLVNCPTSANMALKVFKQVFQEDELKQSPENILEKEREAYKGGRTEVFKKLFESTVANDFKTLNYYDINSAHPAGMTLNMPFEYIRTMKYDNKKVKIDDLTSYHLYYAKSKYVGNKNITIPNLIIKHGNTNISLRETEYAYHWGCELKEAIKNDYEITICEENIYSCKDIFREFANYFYDERNKARKTNEALSIFYKNILNSLYGKFGQKDFNKCAITESMGKVDKLVKGDLSRLRGFDIVNDRIMIEYDDGEEQADKIGSLCRFSSYITATTRCKLSELMRVLGHENIYYCDTDSIYTTATAPAEYLSDNVLGKWKTESTTIQEAVFIAPKTLYCNDPLHEKEDKREIKKAKGIKAKDISPEEYRNLNSGDIESISQTKRMFFRSLEKVRIDDQERNIVPVYNKRQWVKNDSQAFESLKQYIEFIDAV